MNIEDLERSFDAPRHMLDQAMAVQDGALAAARLGGEGFNVPDGGITYRVRFAGRPEPDAPVGLWECSCGREQTCEHISRVGRAMGRLADLMGYD